MSRPESPAQAHYHQVHLPEHPARAVVWRVVAEHLSRYVPANADVLEIGAGHCQWINAVRAKRKVAVDVWPELPRHVGPGVEPIVLDVATALSRLGQARFDVVLASNLLEHFEPDIASSVIGNVHAVLRQRGAFIIVQPNFRYAHRQYFDDYTHRSIFTHVSLANLLRSHGFAIDLVRPRFLPYSLRNTRSAYPAWLVRAYLHSPVKPLAGQMLIVARKF